MPVLNKHHSIVYLEFTLKEDFLKKEGNPKTENNLKTEDNSKKKTTFKTYNIQMQFYSNHLWEMFVIVLPLLSLCCFLMF